MTSDLHTRPITDADCLQSQRICDEVGASLVYQHLRIDDWAWSKEMVREVLLLVAYGGPADAGETSTPKLGELVLPLRTRLATWTDFDVAAYHLGVVLGLLPEWPEATAWGEHKWVFWSANPLGDTLYMILRTLTSLGVLEHDGEAFRWVGAGTLLDPGKDQST
jgi:hypothetical protein